MTATSQPGRSPAPAPEPRRRNPAKRAAAKVVSALRGDKYMVNAYPAAEREDESTSA